MSGLKLVFLYSWRIVRREWRRFTLPLASLTVTSVVLLLILLLTAASDGLLSDQARELQGGDVVIESATPIAGESFFDSVNLEPEAVANQLSFSATLKSEAATAAFSLHVIDNAYPLYGELALANGVFSGLAPGQLLLDAAGLEKLNVSVGDTVSFGDAQLVVAEVFISEPTSLFGGFRFLPVAFISQDSFTLANIDPALLRVEYSYAAKLPGLGASDIESIRALAAASPALDVNIAGLDQRGLQFGLKTVSDFLVIAVLITAVLAAVNVYASILYLVTIERKSLAVLLALGLSKRKLVAILGTTLLYIVLLASAIGISIALASFMIAQDFIATNYIIDLPTPSLYLYVAITVALVGLIALMSFIPAIYRSLSLNPRQILIGSDSVVTFGGSYLSLLTITVSTLVPLIALAAFLLDSFMRGLSVILVIAVVYVVISALYTFVLSRLYRVRKKFAFFTRSIVSQKYTDGLFGIVSFTSLFVALTALCVLVLIQSSLERFLIDDLSATVPSTYVLDVQPSQKDTLLSAFPELELFSNTRARIIQIDDVRIQEELDAGNEDISGDLGREYNLTDRNNLLSSETIVGGVWSNGRAGEISVDGDFAEQANIFLGSTVTFLIQGFEVSGEVTSFRETDSRSGLPFFYFVLSPEDIGSFPSVYFGFAYFDPTIQAELGRFLADTMPNVSMIETQALRPLIAQLVGTFLVLILIVTIPPLVIATLLIAMLVISLYGTRKREGARFRALGMTRRRSFWQYMIETISVTLIASVFAYLLGLLAATLVGVYFLELESVVLFDMGLLAGLGLVLFFVICIALYMYKTDTMPLRELLSYE
jgi:putative ABC transport system permease protein